MGLFGVIDGPDAWVRNLKIEVGLIEGANLVGALAGYVRTNQEFNHIEVNTRADVEYDRENINGTNAYIGGVFGSVSSYSEGGTIFLLYQIISNVNIKGGSKTSAVGGVVGALFCSGRFLYHATKVPKGIRNFYQIKYVKEHIGGVVGLLTGSLVYAASGANIEGAAGSKNIGGVVGTMKGVNANLSSVYHFHLTNAELNTGISATQSIYLTIQGNQNVGGLVGAFEEGVKLQAVRKSYVDSQNIKGNPAHIFCPDETKDMVIYSFYASQINSKVFPAAQNIKQFNKLTAKKSDFEAMGFVFFPVSVWQWGLGVNGFPFL